MSKNDKTARWLVVLCILILIPVGVMSPHTADAYIFGVITGFLGTLAGFWKTLMPSQVPEPPEDWDRNYCPECKAFLPFDNHKPMCSKYVPPKPSHVWGCPKNPAYRGGATSQGCRACALGLP